MRARLESPREHYATPDLEIEANRAPRRRQLPTNHGHAALPGGVIRAYQSDSSSQPPHRQPRAGALRNALTSIRGPNSEMHKKPLDVGPSISVFRACRAVMRPPRSRWAWPSPGARRFPWWLVLLTLAACPAAAADWGLITPGRTTIEAVRARYGQPTTIEAKKVDSYDTVQWIYEGAQAPVGMSRMTVDFGILTAQGYKADVVRDFRLDTKPASFNKKLVLDGWGEPF